MMMAHTPPTNVQMHTRTRFEYHMARLRLELRAGAPRSNLLVLVSLCEWLVERCGAGRVVDIYRTELLRAKVAVEWCSETRVAR